MLIILVTVIIGVFIAYKFIKSSEDINTIGEGTEALNYNISESEEAYKNGLELYKKRDKDNLELAYLEFKKVKSTDQNNYKNAQEKIMDTRSKYKHYLSSTEYKAKQKDTTKLLQKLEKELIKTEKELQVLINNKIQAIIKEAEDYKQIVLDSYNKLEEDKKQRIKSLRCQVLELKNSTSIDKEKSIKTAINIMDQIILSEKPKRKLLESILDSITIYKGRIIEFRLKINLQ